MNRWPSWLERDRMEQSTRLLLQLLEALGIKAAGLNDGFDHDYVLNHMYIKPYVCRRIGENKND